MKTQDSEGKILTREEAIKKVAELKKQGKKVVFTNGCFDLIHIGHVTYLREARNCGDVLIVAVNTDESITKIKGSTRPILTFSERQRILAGFEMVDYVTSFEEESVYNFVGEINPDVLVKGGDYDVKGVVGYDIVQKNGGEVKPLHVAKGVSTTQIVNNILQKFSEA